MTTENYTGYQPIRFISDLSDTELFVLEEMRSDSDFKKIFVDCASGKITIGELKTACAQLLKLQKKSI